MAHREAHPDTPDRAESFSAAAASERTGNPAAPLANEAEGAHRQAEVLRLCKEMVSVLEAPSPDSFDWQLRRVTLGTDIHDHLRWLLCKGVVPGSAP